MKRPLPVRLLKRLRNRVGAEPLAVAALVATAALWACPAPAAAPIDDPVVAEVEISGVKVALSCSQARDTVARLQAWKDAAAARAAGLPDCDGTTASGCAAEWMVWAHADGLQKALVRVVQTSCPNA